MPQFYDFLMSFCNIRNWSHSISILPLWKEFSLYYTFWKGTETLIVFFSIGILDNRLFMEKKVMFTKGKWQLRDKFISLTLKVL